VYDPLINWDQNKKRSIGDDLSEVLNPIKSSVVDALSTTLNSMSPSGIRIIGTDSVLNTDAISKPTQNKRALDVLERIVNKLNGTEFGTHIGKLGVDKQVDLLIEQARSNLILCQSYLPWCPYW